jgi:hypothetical protein
LINEDLEASLLVSNVRWEAVGAAYGKPHEGHQWLVIHRLLHSLVMDPDRLNYVYNRVNIMSYNFYFEFDASYFLTNLISFTFPLPGGSNTILVLDMILSWICHGTTP